jgi:hypothetical protein
VPLPFASCGALFLLALPGMLLISGGARGHEDEPHVPWQRILPRMWMIAIGAAFFAMFDTVALSLLPLYAMRHGIATELAVLSATVVLVGDTALQFAFGWLADHVGRRKVHIGCGVACVLLPMLPLRRARRGCGGRCCWCWARWPARSTCCRWWPAASALKASRWSRPARGQRQLGHYQRRRTFGDGSAMQTAGDRTARRFWCGAAIFIASAVRDWD